MKKILDLIRRLAPESRKELIRALLLIAAGLTVLIDGATDGLDIVNHAIAVLSGEGSPMMLWSVDCRSELGAFLTVFGADCNACWGSQCPAPEELVQQVGDNCDTVIGALLRALGIAKC